ncbi:hypothetical protein SLEP1_g10386 [Rubroshorea leprosula]|uniref:Uncharacterized protein n=1 Tax=Rubroshorea leprosula TaxID=152421 RepID=A0AAV5IGH0_9ROSI|nr:hypothetical protein SLEP1_g10386 [Rubroshorea leprosula]
MKMWPEERKNVDRIEETEEEQQRALFRVTDLLGQQIGPSSKRPPGPPSSSQAFPFSLGPKRSAPDVGPYRPGVWQTTLASWTSD